MSKQDRQGVRTATDLDIKYNFGKMQKNTESALQEANNTNTAITSHVSDKDNPHGVTADQVNARPDTWMPTASDVGARPDTWLPSLAEIGAAPSGYGLGAGAKYIGTTDLNNYKVGGWYQFTKGATNAPCDYGMMLVIPGNAYNTDTFQYTFSRYPANIMYLRQLFDGSWSAWECVNPPMEEGKEYRTTERYKGKPVYAKLINLGAMPNAKTLTKYDLAENVNNLVDAKLTLDKGDSICIDNKFTELKWYIGCYSKPYIEYSSTTDKSAYTGFLLLKYTKSTD